MKSLTRDQLQSRKDKAVRFTENVLGDPERAAEIAGESLEHYAERRKIQLTNPRRRNDSMPTKQELIDQIADLKDENMELQDQLDAIADIVNPDDVENGDDDDSDDEDSGDDENGDSDNGEDDDERD